MLVKYLNYKVMKLKYSKMMIIDSNRDTDLCCFLCNDRGEDDDPLDKGSNLHKAETFSLSKRVKDCATKTNNFRLLAKIGSSDLIALDAYYHLYCYIKLIREAEGEDKAKEHDFDREIHLKELTFYELVEYVEEFRGTGIALSMSDISKQYSEAMKKAGFEIQPHTSSLR